jgi:hypothetical protein
MNSKKIQHSQSKVVDQVDDQDTSACSEMSDFDVVLDIEKQGKLTFNMPEEFYDPNKKIAKIKILNKNNEMKVIESDALEGIKGKDIREIIESSSDVKKVVIEQVTINDAKRLSLLYSHDDDVSSDLENSVLAELNVNNPIAMLGDEGALYLKNIELSINQSFLNISNVIKLKNKDNSNLQKKTDQSFDDVSRNDNSEHESGNVFDLKLKGKNSQFVETKNEISKSHDNAVYKKQTLVRKTKKTKPNDFYYQAKNHRDLFKVGNSYYEDVKKGVKSFCFTSINAHEEQQKTVFGISAFFNYHSELNVTIVTESIEDTYYLKHIKDLKKNVKTVLNGELQFEYYSVDGIDIIELKEFRSAFNLVKDHTFSEFLEELVDDSELVLWDLPQIELLDKEKEMFFPITMIVEYVSLIVKSENNKMKDVEKMLDYYNKYNVNVKGLIYSNSERKNKLESDG